MLILVAEDDEVVLKTIEFKLKKEGYEVDLARNGKEAVEAIQGKKYDLVISDIMMPFASGIEILTAIREKNTQTFVIILTSMGQEHVVTEAFQLGADDFMVKPFSPNELVLRVNRLKLKL